MKRYFLFLCFIAQSTIVFAMQQPLVTPLDLQKKTWGENLRGLAEQYPDIVFLHGDTSLPQVALTFSNVCDSPLLEAVLGLLESYKVPATFFIDGKDLPVVSEHLPKMMLDGHELGTHGFHHRDVTKIPVDDFVQELEQTETAFSECNTAAPLFFRPHGGLLNEAVVTTLGKHDYKVVIWSIDPQNWRQGKTGAEICSEVIQQLTNGAIILIHLDKNVTRFLDDLIVAIKSKNVSLVGLSSVLPRPSTMTDSTTDIPAAPPTTARRGAISPQVYTNHDASAGAIAPAA